MTITTYEYEVKVFGQESVRVEAESASAAKREARRIILERNPNSSPVIMNAVKV